MVIVYRNNFSNFVDFGHNFYHHKLNFLKKKSVVNRKVNIQTCTFSEELCESMFPKLFNFRLTFSDNFWGPP